MSQTFCLTVHADYRCRHSGACCSSHWAIPIEAPRYRDLAAAVASGQVPRPAEVSEDDEVLAPAAEVSGTLPAEMAGVLRTRGDGTCVFFDRDGHRCEIHRHAGHAALPRACQQFPRVTLHDRRGLFVTLSHYCPTAAGLLFEEEDRPLRLVADAPAFPPEASYEGLDARETFPPLLRPGVLLDWDTLAAWDRFALAALDRETRDANAALQRLHDAGEHLRQWWPDEGPLVERLATYAARTGDDADRRADEPFAPGRGRSQAGGLGQHSPSPWTAPAWARCLAHERDVHAAVPRHLLRQLERDATERDAEALQTAGARWVEPAWPLFTRPLCRYLAAKLVASWVWYQGGGLRTVLRSLDAALALVRLEAARQTTRHGRMLDHDLLRESIRRTDLLLVHLAAPEVLADRWRQIEDTSTTR